MFTSRVLISDEKVTDVPNGKYHAIFSGWVISFFFIKEHKIKSSKTGIRGTAHCSIEVENGSVYSVPDKN